MSKLWELLTDARMYAERDKAEKLELIGNPFLEDEQERIEEEVYAIECYIQDVDEYLDRHREQIAAMS